MSMMYREGTGSALPSKERDPPTWQNGKVEGVSAFLWLQFWKGFL